MFSIMFLLSAGMDRSHTYCEETLHPAYFDHSLNLEECYQHCEVEQITHRYVDKKCYINLDCYRVSMPWDSVTGTFGRRALLSEPARFLQTGSQLSYAVSRMLLGTLLGQELLCYDVHTVWCV